MNRLGAFLLLAITAGPVSSAGPAVGDPIGQLNFKDIRFVSRNLDDLPKSRATVLVFLDTGCPVARRYVPELKQIEKDYRDKGVTVVAMFAGAEDSISGLASYALRHDVPFPCVKDVDGACATKLGVTMTPEVAVLDAGRRLRYRGRIDDQYMPSGVRPAATKRELRDAIEAIVAGKEVAVRESPAVGCRITPAPAVDVGPVNFAEHVAPILRKHCQECHRPNTVAPFSLIEPKQVAARAKAIAEVVRDGSMPPWYGAPEHTDFINRRGLSAKEKDTLLAWLHSPGKPVGDAAKLPPPLEPAAEWRIGTPDLLLSTGEHEIPESGDVPYRYAFLPHLFTHDTWVEAVEIKPTNPKVLHHGNLAFAQIGAKFSVNNFITGAVPGGEAMTLPTGVAVKIPAGSVLALQLHYVATGKPEKCAIRVGFRYPRGVVEQQLRLAYLATSSYAIPPGAPHYRVSVTRTLPCDAVGVGLFSHMHVRGKDMSFIAHTPDGKSETLLAIPNFSFNWQHAYRWEFGKKTWPQGTKLQCVAHYDNSPFNPFNPDPAATVLDGQQTYEEMLNGFAFYVDAKQKLNLRADPKTGAPLAQPGEK